MNFLVVDDSRAIRWLMAQRLEQLGHQPHAVGSGPEALSYLGSNGTVDLVLLDFTMPEMDGMETFLRIRESWSEIPVVMITSLESTHLAVEFLRAGGDMFLVKPVNFDILELIIKEVLEKARLRTQYREAHEALAKSEAHARAVIETSPNAIVTFAEDGTIRKFYGAAERIFDYRARTVEGEGIGVLFAEQPENAPGMGSGLVLDAAGDGETAHEYLARRRGGEPFPIELRVSEMNLADERLFVATCTDITARKRAESLTTRLGRIIENAINEIYVFNADTLKFIQANRGARGNLGYVMEELVALTPVDLATEYDERTFRELLDPLRQGEREEVVFETVYRRKDGSSYDAGMRVQYMGRETPPIFVAVGEDITERKRAEAELRESEAKFRAIVEGDSLFGTFVVQPNGEDTFRLIYASPTLAEMSGHAPDELQGDVDILDLVSPQDRAMVRRMMAQGLRGADEGAKFVFALARRGGESLSVEARIVLTAFEDRPTVIGLLRSMTAEQEAKELARKAELARAAAEDATRAKSAFLANISHELRTPLTAVIGFAEQAVVRIAEGDVDTVREHLARVVANSERLAHVIDEVLDLSVIEAGAKIYRFEAYAVRDVVDDVIADLRALAEKRKLLVGISDALPDGHPAVFDRSDVSRVVVNLLSNAIKFANPASTIRIALWRENAQVFFSIANRGIGVPDDELERIFESFAQSSRTDQGAGGTGLGLALCKLVIESHGGRIWAESQDGDETVFTFRIPEAGPERALTEESIQ